jgi:PAS domain S-box-containing protein
VSTTPATTTLFESISEGFVLLDHRLHYVYVNPAAELLMRRTLAEIKGHHVWDVFPPTPERTPFQEAVNRAHASGVPTGIQALNMARGVWYDVRTSPYAGGVAVFFRDVSEQKTAEARMAQVEHKTIPSWKSSSEETAHDAVAPGAVYP